MAAKKTSSASKKTAGKTQSGQKKAPAEKKPTKAQEQQNLQLQQAKRQRSAILLLAAALLMIFIAAIEGQMVWAFLHHALFGAFGICAWAIPATLIALAVIFAINKPLGSMKSEFVFAALVVILLSGIVHVAADLHTQDYLENTSLSLQIQEAWNYESIFKSGGVLGTLVGCLFFKLAGRTPALLTMILGLVVAILLFSGTTLVAVYKAFVNPVKKVGSAADARLEEGMRRHKEKEEEREKRRIEREQQRKAEEAARAEAEATEEESEAPTPAPSFGSGIAIGPEAASGLGFEAGESERKVPTEAEKKRQKKHGVDTSKFAPPSLPDMDEPGGMMPPEDELLPIPDKITYDNPVEETQPEDEPVVEVPQIPKKTPLKKPVEKKPAPVQPSKPQTEFEPPVLVEEENTYKFPPIDCLSEPVYGTAFGVSSAEIEQKSKQLIDTLESFNVQATITGVNSGPTVTRYELLPAAGVKISKITNLADDIALRLAATGVRIEAPIPGKAAIGIEVPNRTVSSVSFREIYDTDVYRAGREKSLLNVAIGKDIAGNVICADLAKMPHLLVAGTTGSGKSVCVNSMIMSILYNARPDEVKLLMIDPKQVEFTAYAGIPHLLVPVVCDPRKAAGALNWAVTEMTGRYKKFSEKGVRDISGYNRLAAKNPDLEPMSRVVIFIDELSDLMMVAQNEVEDAIMRLAQMARAAGMHLVIATQRPSVNVLTGVIKANIPSRIALSVSSQVDSRTILDCIGAEKLLGKGDLLYAPIGISKPLRVQGCFLSDGEIESVVNFIKNQGETSYDENVMDEIERQAVTKKKGAEAPVEDSGSGGAPVDEKLKSAIEIVVEAQMASTTLLQRKLSLGYARAARLIDELEERKIVGPFEGSKPRKVLITKQQWLEMCACSEDDASSVVEDEEPEEYTDYESYDEDYSQIPPEEDDF